MKISKKINALLLAVLCVLAPCAAQPLIQNSSSSGVKKTDDGIQKASDELLKSQATEYDAKKYALLAMSSADYPVTAGDIYQLSFLAGSKPVTYAIPVDTSYKIRVANLAVLNVRGRTFLDVKNSVEQIVSKNFPMSAVQFVLASPGFFYVQLKGEVDFSVDAECWGLTRLYDAVEGHLTDYSSLRDVQVEHSSGEKKTYDVFRGKRSGDTSQNPYLRPGDIVTVSKASKKVTLKGEVERPGAYSVLDGDSISELISFYGSGFTDFADTSVIQVTRTHSEDGTYETLYLTEQSQIDSFALQDNDAVFIDSISSRRPVVFFEGAIETGQSLDEKRASPSSSSISVRFAPGEKYGSFVRKKKDLFSDVSDLENAYIRRGQQVIPLDVKRILYDADFSADEILCANDTVVIPFRQFFVSVSGAVANPGRYPYIPDRDWMYYIGLAGGFLPARNSFDSVRIIDMNGNRKSKSDPIVPETTITAASNSFTYYFGLYAPVATTVLSLITSIFTVIAVTSSN